MSKYLNGRSWEGKGHRESWKSYKEDLNIGEKPLEP
jgi:hypothetical protein